jgi:hypothetical protein
MLRSRFFSFVFFGRVMRANVLIGISSRSTHQRNEELDDGIECRNDGMCQTLVYGRKGMMD